MNYMDEYDDDKPGKSSLPISYMVSVMVVFMLLVFGLVIFLNRDRLGGSDKDTQADKEAVTVQEETGAGTGLNTETDLSLGTSQIADLTKGSADGSTKITAEDLDFWDMYPEETQESVQNDAVSKEETESQAANDPSTDGRHTLVKHVDGKEEWISINNYLPKNNYDLTSLVCKGNVMQYYQDGDITSYMGVDISKYNNYVDFNDLKNAGVQFVMIRVGARGYESGTITIDDYYLDNIRRATDAGLHVGLYFYSQAISTEEAKEEVQTVLDQIGEYKITYPIAFDMEYADNDSSRIERLSNEQKTSIANTFCSAVKAAGYIPMIYGDKEWLLMELQLSRLTQYDIWLSQPGDTPDYPYRFGMWQYNTSGSIDGIAGNANLNISFIDYSVK